MSAERRPEILGKYPYLKISSLLLLVLLLPFVLLYRGPKVEVYPAILLPAGLGMDSWKPAGSEHQYPAFYGYSDHRQGWQKLDVRKTLYPLSPAHAYAVSRYLRKENTPSAAVWQWLNANIHSQHLRMDTLMLGIATASMNPDELPTTTITDVVYLGNH